MSCEYLEKIKFQTGRKDLFRNNKPLYKKVAQISDFKMFGDIALAYNNSRRTATIVSEQIVHLVCLDRKSYAEIGSQVNKKTEYLLGFLKKSFSGLKNDQLANLLSKMKEKSYKLNEVIVSRGIKPKFCYIISQGEVTVKNIFNFSSGPNSRENQIRIKILLNLKSFQPPLLN